jgi:hypothetical protein
VPGVLWRADLQDEQGDGEDRIAEKDEPLGMAFRAEPSAGSGRVVGAGWWRWEQGLDEAPEFVGDEAIGKGWHTTEYAQSALNAQAELFPARPAVPKRPLRADTDRYYIGFIFDWHDPRIGRKGKRSALLDELPADRGPSSANNDC